MIMDVEELIQRNEPGVDVRRLKAGTKLIVKTRNSTYQFVATNAAGELYDKGGKKIPKAAKIVFSGSTWGGSCLKVGWIGLDMQMEIRITPTRVLTTTPVRSIRVVGADKQWFYDLP